MLVCFYPQSLSGGGQSSTPVQVPLGLVSAPLKTTSLPSGPPVPPPTTASSSSTAASGFEVCSVSEPACLVTQESSSSTTTVHTPSTHRRFVVADVTEEQDSPDELSTQGSTESLHQGEGQLQQPGGAHEHPVTQVETATTVSHHRSVGESSGNSVEVIVVSSLVAPETSREDLATPRPPLMSTPSYSSALDSSLTARQRSTSLPHKLSSVPSSTSAVSTTTTMTTSERLGVALPTMPVIPERSLTSESEVFTAEPLSTTHMTSGTVPASQSNHHHTNSSGQQKVHQPHPIGKPHPPSCSDHSPSPQPQAPPTTIPLADISQHHSEALSSAFMSFIFSMNQILREPAIQPLIHHLEHHYRGAHPSYDVAPPPSSSAPHPKKDEDADLKRKIEE